MISLKDKHDCCGCTACAERCPQKCITMQYDTEGFIYPIVKESNCIHCNLCDTVCPVINQSEPELPIKVFAAKNKDNNVLLNSSSGGVFTSMAEYIIGKGGVVFGACFDEQWNVVLKHTETLAGLEAFRGSKYVQCDVGNCYIEAECFLKNGRLVLFTGTPCQIAGLKKFLRKEYENLYTVDIICHGAPSPGIWKDYVKKIPAKLAAGKNTVFSSLKYMPVITGINFRDKTDGWKKYGFSAEGIADHREAKNSVFPPKGYVFREYHQDNVYLRGFLHNLYLRPSCHRCPARKGKSGADIQLGDYWGVIRRTPEFYDSMGVSLALIYSEKGVELFNKLDLLSCQVSYNDVMDCNMNVEIDEAEPSNRRMFFKDYERKGFNAITKYCDEIDGHNLIWYIKKNLSKIKHIKI